MNILIADSWLREYLDTSATPNQIMECLSLCGPSIERINKIGNDFVYEIEITSNRIDTASVYGIAREASVILPRFNIPAKLKTINIPYPVIPKKILPMVISDENNICNRIMGMVLTVDKTSQSPTFMKDRLEKSGIRSLNNLVDITNFVMMEIGHPCHVFDYDRVKTNKFIIRNSQKNEPIITLDNKKYLLNEEDVVIDDGTGRIIDLPGIMGTENSVITESTRRIIFFIESNNPVLIRKTAIRYQIRTMAASINEKHPDPNLVETAFFRGIELYKKYAGGKEAGKLIDIYPDKPKPRVISLTYDFINERLGVVLNHNDIESILLSLGFAIISNHSESIKVTPPTFRQFDVLIPEDIVEEVARIYGYHNLPSKLMTGEIPITPKSEILNLEAKIKNLMKGFGFTETYNYSFTDKKTIIKSGLNPEKHLKLANPLTEDFVYLRTTLISSLLNNINGNQDHSNNLNLFELANIYIPQVHNLPKEKSTLTIICQNSIFHLKGIVETLFKDIGILEYNLKPASHHFFNNNYTLSYIVKDKLLATIGKINIDIKNNFELIKDSFISEVFIEELIPFIAKTKKYVPISPYPPIREDLTLIMPEKINIGPILDKIRTISPLIDHIDVTNCYKNRITIKITYHNNLNNLSSDQVKAVRNKILQVLDKQFSIRIP